MPYVFPDHAKAHVLTSAKASASPSQELSKSYKRSGCEIKDIITGSTLPFGRDPKIRDEPAVHALYAGLFSLITVWADRLARDAGGALKANAAAWYCKQEPTFSDALAAVRRALWTAPNLSMSQQPGETITIPCNFLNRVLQTLWLAA